MLAKELKMDGDKILGAEDFVASYSTENADAFVTKTQPAEATPPAQAGNANKPQFVGATPGAVPPKQPSLTDMMRAANEGSGTPI